MQITTPWNMEFKCKSVMMMRRACLHIDRKQNHLKYIECFGLIEIQKCVANYSDVTAEVINNVSTTMPYSMIICFDLWII